MRLRSDNDGVFLRSNNGRLFLLLSLPVFIVSLACRNKLTPPEETPTEIQITASKYTIISGDTLQLCATVRLAGGTLKDVTSEATWSNYPRFAGVVEPGGLFVAANDSSGIETVIADYQGQSANVEVEVVMRGRTLSVWPAWVHILAGSEVQFEAVVEFFDDSRSNVTDEVIWSVSPGVAGSIDGSGRFRAASGMSGIEVVTGSFHYIVAQSQVLIQEVLNILFEMITIPAGSFTMGDDNSAWTRERPAHEVTIDAFEIGKYEVTNAQYTAYLNEAMAADDVDTDRKYVWSTKGPFAWRHYIALMDRIEAYEEEGEKKFRVVPGYEEYPVVWLTWHGAAAFCAHYGLRLPTEAEWEKACRGGRQLEYGTQDGSISHDLVNYSGVGGRDSYNGFAPVGSFPPNPYGLYDMSGNAPEHVFDRYDENYYAGSPTQNPMGPGSVLFLDRLRDDLTVCRGGSAAWSSQRCRSAFRGIFKYESIIEFWALCIVGFRVARSVE